MARCACQEPEHEWPTLGHDPAKRKLDIWTKICDLHYRHTWDVHALHELLRPPLDLLELVRQAALGGLHVALLQQELRDTRVRT